MTQAAPRKSDLGVRVLSAVVMVAVAWRISSGVIFTADKFFGDTSAMQVAATPSNAMPTRVGRRVAGRKWVSIASP